MWKSSESRYDLSIKKLNVKNYILQLKETLTECIKTKTQLFFFLQETQFINKVHADGR